MMADVGPCLPQPLHNADKVDLDSIRYLNAEFVCVSHSGNGLACANQRLGRHTADVQTIAAHQVLFDNRDFRSESRCTDGSY